jgi:hypothetical protein
VEKESFWGVLALFGLGSSGFVGTAMAQGPFAAEVISYEAGSVPNPQYTKPGTALGSPERMTGEYFQFPGAVTVFNPAFGPDEIVSVGGGGHLTLAFDHFVVDDPGNPFGVDFLVFGNAGFIDVDWPSGRTGSPGVLFGVGAPALVHVSADGLDWRPISPLRGPVDGMFPTLGWADLADPYSPTPGNVPTDFTRPVNPSLDLSDMTFAQIVSAYDGSGGGTPFDLAGTGLGAIRFIRFTNPSSAGEAFEIDAVSDVVPAPTTIVPLAMFLTAWRRRR